MSDRRPVDGWDDEAFRAGYLMGEGERVALATANQNLRTEVEALLRVVAAQDGRRMSLAEFAAEFDLEAP